MAADTTKTRGECTTSSELTTHSEGSVVLPVKEISLLELVLRAAARVAAVSGVIGLLVWLTWVMLDVKNMQSGFTLPY
ncbi:MAG: hypothetical protein FJ056_02195 [Cyanobacteria bacterium M_surface_10_m2_179]|nr:hypothetical protein [Cyanobacteria bacterium M_surface_10_m2_179]